MLTFYFLLTNCRDQFIDYWIKSNMLTMGLASQIYTILKQPGHEYLTQVGFDLDAMIISKFTHDVYSLRIICLKLTLCDLS